MPATYEPIATTTLSSAASTITFSSIPGTYTDLRVIWTTLQPANINPVIIYNSDTLTNYSATTLRGNGASASSVRYTSDGYLYPLGYSITTDTGYPALFIVDIFGYAGSTFKTTLISYSQDKNGSGYTMATVGLYRSTSAINSITLKNDATSNFSIGTTATLYGIKAA